MSSINELELLDKVEDHFRNGGRRKSIYRDLQPEAPEGFQGCLYGVATYYAEKDLGRAPSKHRMELHPASLPIAESLVAAVREHPKVARYNSPERWHDHVLTTDRVVWRVFADVRAKLQEQHGIKDESPTQPTPQPPPSPEPEPTPPSGERLLTEQFEELFLS